MYKQGDLKISPDRQAVAIRTIFPDEEPTGNMAWLAAESSGMSRHYRTADVADWTDLAGP